MRKLQILLAEIIGIPFLLAWLFVKYPDAFDRVVPWAAFGVLWHITLEIFGADCIKSRLLVAYKKAGRPAMLWAIVFCFGGLLSVGYLYAIQRGLASLASLKHVEPLKNDARPTQLEPPQPHGNRKRGGARATTSILLPKKETPEIAAVSLIALPTLIEQGEKITEGIQGLFDAFDQDKKTKLLYEDENWWRRDIHGKFIKTWYPEAVSFREAAFQRLGKHDHCADRFYEIAKTKEDLSGMGEVKKSVEDLVKELKAQEPSPDPCE